MPDVHRAAGCAENPALFYFHENPNPKCPAGRNIHKAPDEKLARMQKAMEDEMQKITLAEIACDTEQCIRNKDCPRMLIDIQNAKIIVPVFGDSVRYNDLGKELSVKR